MLSVPPPRVLVFGDDIGVYLAVARSLGRRGLEVHVVPADPPGPGIASRYVAAVQPLPAYQADAEAWLKALKALDEEHRYAMIFPCSDDALMRLHHHAHEIGRERLGLPNDAAFEAFTDKMKTRALAQSAGVPVAQGCAIGAGTDPEHLATELGLPMVLKPATSHRVGDRTSKTRAEIVRSIQRLRAALQDRTSASWLAEKFCPGVGVGVSVLAGNGEILFAAQHRRLRTFSETGGSSVRITEAVDPQLLADVEALAGATGLTGVAMFEFRQDRDSGSHVLLEVNARFWGSLPLAVAAGADFPARLWDMLNDRDSLPPASARPSVLKCNLTAEMDRIAAEADGAASFEARMRAAGSLATLLPSLLMPSRVDSWAADDPAPFRLERRQVLGRVAEAVGNRLPWPRRAARGAEPIRA